MIIKKRKAFALVLALAMMGFMVLLVVTLATMVQMQMRMSRQTLVNQKARQAAKFAAFQAMNAVQVALGPDQRISANAMMFDVDLARGINELDHNTKYTWWENPMEISREDVEEVTDTSLSQNRYWVGVWDSAIGKSPSKYRFDEDRNSYLNRMSKSAITWLVSGNIIRSQNDVDGADVVYRPEDSLDKGKYVRAVSGGSSLNETLSGKDIDVLAPLVTLERDTNGITGEKLEDGKETRIAWWVGDEGQKACLNAVATKDQINHADGIQYRIQSLPFYSGIHALTVSNFGSRSGSKAFDLYFDDDDEQNGSIAKIRALDDIRALDVIKSDKTTENSLPSKVFFHSATFNSRGVLANTREGGLKKDLSLGLTRSDYGNEPETPDLNADTPPEYFELPFGIAGYEYKTSTAYPILPFSAGQSRRNLTNNKLKYRGHMFGPQEYGHEDMETTGVGFDAASAIAVGIELFSDTYLFKDPGGPLWDQLRSYYNLRTNNAGTLPLKARQQTDDRYGFKPVVKRFQVFFVPTFVNYSGAQGCNSYDFGIRLHIVPFLVLWNPYDTKIDGDTYYVLNLTSTEEGDTLGAFRLAVGYDDGDYFQCLRDFRTERISVQDKIGYRFDLKDYDIYGNNAVTTAGTGSLSTAITGSGTALNTSTRYNISTNTYWYNKKFYPLGYGGIAPSSFDNNNTYVYTSTSAVRDTGLSGGGEEDSTAKILPCPLYLNNMIVSIEHGNWYTKYDSSGKRGFNTQQDLDEPKPWSSTYAQGKNGFSVGDMHFVVYDSKGIPAGKAKVFAMTKVLNYHGKLTSGGPVRDTDGPNGAISFDGKVNTYKDYDAMLRGLDDKGKMGSCFYIDVPHAESEHIARYQTQNYDTSDNKPIEVLFNIQEINNNQKNRSGGSLNLSENLSDLYIDMQPVVGVYSQGFLWGGGGNSFMSRYYPFKPGTNSTPIYYGLSSIVVGSGNQQLPYTTEQPENTSLGSHCHYRFYFQTYIWRYGNEIVENFAQTNAIYKRANSDYTVKALRLYTLPSMSLASGISTKAHNQQSFPDPSFFSRSNQISGGSWHAVNYIDIALNSTNNMTGGQLVSNSSNHYYFTPVYDYTNYENSDSRFFLSWATINARRHGMNFWQLYGKNTNLYNKAADVAPQAKRGILYDIRYDDVNYGDKIQSYIAENPNNVPWGYSFGMPYSRDTVGFQPIFNRRMFVNNDVTSSIYDFEYSPREINLGDNANGSEFTTDGDHGNFYNNMGSMQYSYMGMLLSQGDDDDGISNLGYTPLVVDGYTSVGSGQDQGVVYQSVTHHILRETEVVSNPAALSSAGLSFGVGAVDLGQNIWSEDSVQKTLDRSSGLMSPQSLQTSFAIGNSLCPSRVAPERNFEVMWLDMSSTFRTNDFVTSKRDGTQGDGIRNSPNYYSDKNVLYDMSYNLNNILWDEYFFSTFPYREDEASYAQDENGYVVPQNPRLEYYVSGSDKLKSSDLKSTNREDQFTENAGKLWIKGPFNINSTSIDAWKAVLATYYNVKVEGYSRGTVANSQSVPFHRYAAPYTANVFTSSSTISSEDKVFDGFRSLDDDELEQLACSIVEHVKDRGPFYSMSDFVNRRIDTYAAEQRFNNKVLKEAGLIPNVYSDEKKFSYVPEYAQYEDRDDINDTSKTVPSNYTSKIAHLQKGILQAAIDGTDINSAFHGDRDLIISIDNNRNMAEAYQDNTNYKLLLNPTDTWENWRGAVGPQLTGAPTYLMQQDILARIGSFLTARSDTFKIRAYGDVRNPISGVIEGKAWCEMVVQRVPEYICENLSNQEAWRISDRERELGTQNEQRTSSGDELDGIIDELEPVNKALGRRFKVVSFRWLNEKEI